MRSMVVGRGGESSLFIFIVIRSLSSNSSPIVMLLMCREATRLRLDPAPVRQRKVAVVLAALWKTAAEGSRGFEAIVQPVLLKP